MLNKLKARVQFMLLHPAVTLLTVLTGVVSGSTILATELTTLGVQLGPLTGVLPKTSKFIVILTTVSTICTVIAGVGRSFVTMIDQNQKPASA